MSFVFLSLLRDGSNIFEDIYSEADWLMAWHLNDNITEAIADPVHCQ